MDRNLNLDIDYDEVADVLDIMICKPYTTDNFELDFNYTLRFDPKSKELVGLTIVNYAELFPGPQTSEERRLVSGSLLMLFRQLLREQILTIDKPTPKRAA